MTLMKVYNAKNITIFLLATNSLFNYNSNNQNTYTDKILNPIQNTKNHIEQITNSQTLKYNSDNPLTLNLDEYNTVNARAQDILASMTLEEKINQILVVPIDYALDNKNNSFGGILYLNNHIKKMTSKEIILTNISLQEKEIPPIICIDQEGGRVDRLKNINNINNICAAEATDFIKKYKLNNENTESISFPSQEIIGKTYESLAEENKKEFLENYSKYAYGIAKTLNYLGFTINFAPVLDLGKKDFRIEIEDRSYSHDKNTTMILAKAYINGFNEYKTDNLLGPVLVVKHFPGLGYAKENTHHQSAKISISKEEFYNDLIVYDSLHNDINAIMLSHATYTNIDSKNPFSSSENANKIIKKTNLNSMIFSDDMSMVASKKNYLGAAKNCDFLIITDPKDILFAKKELENLPIDLLDNHVSNIIIYKLQNKLF
ncbi:MAG: glycoside hydrolase family 3 N-terminal domain-containing protein [Candidatus Woesearchaeota archaeon]